MQLKLSRYALFSNEEPGRLIQDKIGKAKIEDSRIPDAIMAVDIATSEKVVLEKARSLPLSWSIFCS